MAHATAAIRCGRHLSRRGGTMATQEQVDDIMRLAERVHSSDAFRCMDEANAGIGGTLRILAEARGVGTVVTAGDIAERLGVTTARVAALLKRLESKGLIARRRSQADARVTEVVLTEEGSARVQAFREDVRAQVAMLVDELGEERLRAFFLTAAEVRARLRPPSMQLWAARAACVRKARYRRIPHGVR